MLKAVFFDIDNTLLDFDACSEEAIRLGFEERGLRWEHELFSVFLRVNNALWEELEQGKLTQQGLYDIRFDRVFAAMGVKLDGADFERSFRLRLHDLAVPVPGAEALLSSLYGHFRLFAASNGPHEQQVNRLRTAGQLRYMEAVFTSELLGASKPDPAFFRAVFSRLPELSPEECCMIGDSLSSDIAAAVGCGMHALWYSPAGKPLPERFGNVRVFTEPTQVPELLKEL